MYKEVIGGVALLGIVLSLFSYLYTRIGKVEENVVGCDLCQQRYSEIKERLDKGDNKFYDIESKLDKHLETLVRIETKVTMILNGNFKIKDNI